MYSKSNKISKNDFKPIKIKNYVYRESDVLGQGYSSTVYKGQPTKLDKTEKKMQPPSVAIKKIKTQALKNQLNQKLLESEIETLKLIKGCDHLLAIYDIIEEEQQIYIVSELCQLDLEKKIKQRINFKLGEKYIMQIIKGFESMFKKQIVHRDLKPSNILLDCNGDIKIGDFGFAINAKNARKQTMYNIGSPLYMAPQALQKNQYSFYSDIWAIGIIAYEIFAGKTPWKAKTEEQLIQAIKNHPIEQVMKKERIAMPTSIKKLIIQTVKYDKYQRMPPLQLISYDFGKSKKLVSPGKDMKDSKFSQVTMKDRSSFKTSRKKSQIIENEDLMVTRKKQQSCAGIKKTISHQNYTKNIIFEKKEILSGAEKPKTFRPATSTMCESETINKKKSSNSCYSPHKLKSISILNNKQQALKKTIIRNKISDEKVKLSCYISEHETDHTEQNNLKEQILEKFKIIIQVYELLYKVTENVCSIEYLKENEKQFEVEIEKLIKSYCCLINKLIYKIKDYSHSNFLKLPTDILRDFMVSKAYRKIQKINTENLQRFSKVKHLKKYWKDSHEPNIQFTINATISLMSKILSKIQKKPETQQKQQKQQEVEKQKFSSQQIEENEKKSSKAMTPKNEYECMKLIEEMLLMKSILAEIKKNGYKLLDKNIDRGTLQKHLNIGQAQQKEIQINEEEQMLIDCGDLVGNSSLQNFKLVSSQGMKESKN